MIKLENVVLASPEQMKFIIEGMRNPMNSHNRSDSMCFGCDVDETLLGEWYKIGPNDLELMQKLSNAGTDHRKFMRMMPIYVRITAPLYWWKEFDTYKVGTVANSCSTMQKITEKEFTLEDFSTEHLNTDREFMMYAPTGYRYSAKDLLALTIETLNHYRAMYIKQSSYRKSVEHSNNDGHISGQSGRYPMFGMSEKDLWWQMIQLLPSSYNQTRNVMLNYEVLANIYGSRKDHKLDEWREFCQWIETLPYSELMTERGAI